MKRSALSVLLAVAAATLLTTVGCVRKQFESTIATQPSGQVRIATVQFSESYDPQENAAVIRRYIAAAAEQHADVVHFHECALSGYGGKVASPDYDWDALRQATESILAEARRRKIWVILGSSHPLTPPHKPHNSLYLISPAGEIVDRYDKRFCTEADLKTYTPGDHFVTFELNGLKCSLLICYDVRFPELYRELYRMGVRVMFQSFHNARREKPGLLGEVIRPSLQAQAACNAMWVSAPNSSAYYSCWGSAFISPEGRIVNQLEENKEGMMINTVDPSLEFYDASGPFRDRALRGVLHSGKPLRDPRSADRKSL